MVHAFILMYFTWDSGEGDHMFLKYLQSRCYPIEKSKVKEVYIEVTPERSRVTCLVPLI